MKQISPAAQTSRKYFYFFIVIAGLVVLTDLAVGVSSRSVDPTRSGTRASENKHGELATALVVADRIISKQQPKTTSAANPVTPLASCSGTSTVTCTGGPGAAVHVATGVDGPTHAGAPYPSSITVSGATSGSTVATVAVTLNGYTATTVNGASSRSMGLLLKSPSGRNLEIMRAVGRGTIDTNNATITIQDGSPSMTSACVNGGNNGLVAGTFAPSAFGCSESGSAEPDYTVSGGPARLHSAQTNGTSTLNSTNNVFTGDTPNGTWSLYLVDDAGFADVTFTDWTIVITVSAASTPSTTTLTPNPATAYRTAPGNSVVLTATVTAGATGTVTFKDGATNLTCAGGNPATVSGNQAVCSTSFSTEGIHSLSANYSGDGTFVSSSGTANVYIQNHATNVGTTYCNAGAIDNNGRSDLAFSNTTPYPSVIFVGDGVNTDINNSVNTVSVTLKNFSAVQTGAMHMLLVAPGGTHAYDFWSNVGSSASIGDYNIVDGSPQIPNSAISPGTYGPTADGVPPDPFTPGPPAPAPQIPGSFFYAPPEGNPNSKTFQTAFAGANAHGAWSLFLYNGTGATAITHAAGGWCLNISAATGFATSVSATSNPNPFATLGASVTFTATVSSAGHPTPNQGTVTFTENGSPLTGAPNGGVANVVNGVASIATSGLPEGDHTITAAYHDSAGAYNDNSGSVQMRVDKVTSTPTLSGSTWAYCNAGGITIPQGVLFVNDTGPGTPNPSNIFVTNLPGTINAVGVTLKGFTVFRPADLESLLVGPGAATANTLDFFSLTGGVNNYGPTDTSFLDTGVVVPANSPPGASNAPTSRGVTSFFASPFYTLPGSVQHATTQGTSTFNTGAGGVYQNSIANGTWSLYFNQLTHSTGSGVPNGWCLNFIENPVTGTGTTAHVGPAPNNHMRQGGTGSVTFSLLNNGTGSTGDPDQAVGHAMTVTGTLPAGLTLGTVPTGSPWNCNANTTTNVTCTNLSAIAQGSTYQLLTIPLNVANNAATSVTISGFTFSGAGMTAGTFASDTITIDPAPILAVNKSHTGTFANGHTAVWNIQVSNNSATAAGATDGSTVTVTDALPSGYTLASFTGTGWSCSATTTVTCTTTAVVPGNGGTFNPIALTVNVASNSPTSVNNVAMAFGGGDVIHTNSGTAVSSNTDTTAATNTMVWNGSVSGDWNTAANWSPSVVPNSGNNASIPTGVLPNEPSLSLSPDAAVTDLTVATGASLTIGSTRTLSVTGNTSVDGQILGSGAVQFGNGSHNLGGTGSFAATIASTLVSGATVTLTSNMQMGSVIINGGATFSLVSHTLSLSGTPTPLTINGTFNSAPSPADQTNAASPAAPEAVGGTVLFNGAAAQNAPGISYSGLTISNSSGVTLSGSATVNLALTLTSGDLNTSSFTLTMPATATSSGSSDVVGNLKRTGFSTAACPSPPCANTLSFGEPDNQITMTAGTTPTDITVTLVKSAPAGFSSAVQRTYTITPNPSNLSGFVATVRLHYLDTELNGNTPESSLSLRRFNGTSWVPYVATTAVDTVNNWVQNNAVQNFSPWTFSKLSPTASNGVVSGRVLTSDGRPVEGALVRLSGGQTRKTITDTNGNYSFDNIDTGGFYTVTPTRANYNFSPFNRSFSQEGNKTEAAFTGTSIGDNANPLDTPEYFVRQQYVDILGREPDEAGFNYWSEQILACGEDASCTRAQRSSVAAAFFIENEAQQTGSFIYDVYAGALGRRPAFNEYAFDRQQVVGGDTLDATKAAFAQGFVQRAEVTAKYQDALTAESFVDALIQSAQSSGGNLNDGRANLVSIYNQAGGDLITSRAAVVRSLADNAAFKQSQYNEAFVLTEYFAYLHRNIDQAGYDFWVNVLNNGDRGNYRGMVCSFITSTEYQRRFSAVVSRSNGECGN